MREDLPVLVLFDGWNSLFRDRVVPWRIAMAERTRAQLERDVLPRYLESQRWYAGKGETRRSRCGIADQRCGSVGSQTWMIALLETDGAGGAGHLFRAARAGVGGRRRRAHARARRRHDRPGAPAGAASACCATPSATTRSAARWSRRSAPARRSPPRAASCASRRRRRFAEIAGDGHRRRCRVRQAAGAEQQLRRDARRAPVPEGIPPAAAGHQPRAGDRPLSSPRSRASRIACRSPASLEYTAPDGVTLTLAHAAGLRRQPGRRLDLHASATSSAASSSSAPRRSRAAAGRARRVPRAHQDARPAHGRAAPRACAAARAIPRSTRSP